MSSILKALRKLEEEKARRQDGSTDIARDILRRGPRARRGAPRGMALMAVPVVAAALAYLWLPVPAPVVRVQSPPGPGTEAVPGRSPSTGTQAQAPRTTRQAVSGEVRDPAPRVAVREERRQPPSPSVATVVHPQPTPLVLSGIAYQEEAEARLAVVNDLPVMEGTVIEGARVEEILRDRVRFSVEGKTFEVALDGR